MPLTQPFGLGWDIVAPLALSAWDMWAAYQSTDLVEAVCHCHFCKQHI
jgi:hypothetical protein